MLISIKFRLQIKKSRLAGFFLSAFLLACQPPPEEIPGALEFARAQQSLQAELPLKATEQLATAIRQGHPVAVTQWLALTQSQLGPLQQYRQLQAWAAEPLSSEQASRLGLWHDTPVMPPALSANTAPAGCQLSVQPVLSTLLSVKHWQQLRQDWPQSDFALLPVCFLAPIVLDSRELRCTEHAQQRISCDPTRLSDIMQQSRAQILLVAAGRGQASFNNGWLQLPELFSPALFRHEFSHALGFIDEYQLSAATAAAECVRRDILANLLLDTSDAGRYAEHWGLDVADLSLTPVDTCRAAGVQAWRPVQGDSHMQHFELAVPALYQQIMQRQLRQSALLMPVQYYFAYLARQQQDMQRWQLLMRRAAAFGYPAALDALEDAGLSLTTR
jgi:hypothetical protein